MFGSLGMWCFLALVIIVTLAVIGTMRYYDKKLDKLTEELSAVERKFRG